MVHKAADNRNRMAMIINPIRAPRNESNIIDFDINVYWHWEQHSQCRNDNLKVA